MTSCSSYFLLAGAGHGALLWRGYSVSCRHRVGARLLRLQLSWMWAPDPRVSTSNSLPCRAKTPRAGQSSGQAGMYGWPVLTPENPPQWPKPLVARFHSNPGFPLPSCCLPDPRPTGPRQHSCSPGCEESIFSGHLAKRLPLGQSRLPSNPV